MQKQGCWKQWYRYHFDWYRYQSLTTSGYRYHLPTASWVPVPLFGTVPIRDFAEKMLDFSIFIHSSSTNLLQFIPYQKSTMESTQNNSKGGLESMKTLFFQVRAFSPNRKSQNMRLGFDFLTLASSNLLFQVV